MTDTSGQWPAVEQLRRRMDLFEGDPTRAVPVYDQHILHTRGEQAIHRGVHLCGQEPLLLEAHHTGNTLDIGHHKHFHHILPHEWTDGGRSQRRYAASTLRKATSASSISRSPHASCSIRLKCVAIVARALGQGNSRFGSP